jgi:uncharacterized repeat protein (TIGR03987 family)
LKDLESDFFDTIAGIVIPTHLIKKEGKMSPFTIIIITLALVFYSVGVWSERIAGRLKPWHLAFFVLGLICDTWGTGLMIEFAGGLTTDIHGITGVAAILLMMIHAAWASVVLLKKDEKSIRNFHKFSVFVWLVWLVPYFSPMLLNLPQTN